MNIYIVTPSFNAAATLNRTIHSVVSQAGNFHIYYHVQDGGSDDDTLALLQHWGREIGEGRIPLSCRGLTFTWDSRKDEGMYHAIGLGFDTFSPHSEAWMTWINADDILLPTALPLLSKIDSDQNTANRIAWVTGAAATCSEGCQNGWDDRLHASEIIVRGLADGTHWPYVQQEGTFFRYRCWNAVDGVSAFGGLRYAGDWNLWRLMAAGQTLYQFNYSTGMFSSHPTQLSKTFRHLYNEEIERLVPTAVRSRSLQELDDRKLRAQYVISEYGSEALQIQYRSLTERLRDRQHRIFGGSVDKRAPASASKATESPKFGEKYAQYGTANFNGSQVPVRTEAVRAVRRGNVVSFNSEWQYPAITERHAFAKVSEQRGLPDGVVYFGFPWATLIDRLHCSKDATGLLQQLRGAQELLRSGERVITVCQHVLLEKFQDLFSESGVTDIFWSHARRGMDTLPSAPQIAIHPFPLYPVQAVEPELERTNESHRTILFSFIGARATSWYISEVRNWIIDHLNEDQRGLIRGRDSWHYEKIVYEHQISGGKEDGVSICDRLIDQKASIDFRDSLRRSVFSLCPSGSGPNSIRLWESIGLGAIPVILADSWRPPGDERLWNEAAVFVAEREEEIRALPERLEEMSQDLDFLERKRRAMRQLWLLYGPDCFIYDLQRIFLESVHVPNLPSLVPTSETLLRMASGLALPGAGDDCPWDAFILGCGTRILLNPEQFLSLYRRSPELRCAWQLAQRHGGSERLSALAEALRSRGVSLEEA